MKAVTRQLAAGAATHQEQGKPKVTPVTNAGDSPHCALATPGETMQTGPR